MNLRVEDMLELYTVYKRKPGPVFRRMDSAIHQIAIFSSTVKMLEKL